MVNGQPVARSISSKEKAKNQQRLNLQFTGEKIQTNMIVSAVEQKIKIQISPILSIFIKSIGSETQ